MKIVRRKSDKIVAFVFSNNEEIELSSSFKAGNLEVRDINSQTHEIIEGVPKPEQFFGSCMAYDDEWYIVNQKAYDKLYIEKLEIAKKDKCKQINDNTERKILSVASRDAQMNYHARFTYLKDEEESRKLRSEEISELQYIKEGWVRIKTLREQGNIKEIQIQACTTIEEFEAKCLELGV